MTSWQPEDIAADNEESLAALIQSIFLSDGFTLILVRCNYTSVREQMAQRLQAECEIFELVLDKSVTKLYTTIKAAVGSQQPSAVMVFGLESLSNIEHVLASTNQVREEFRDNLPFPLILWVTDQVLQKLIQLAPDFESWATIYEFAIASNELLKFLDQTTDEVFTRVLDAGADKFLDNSAFNLAIGSCRRAELESARRDLQERLIALDPELEASLEFVLGRDASSLIEQSRQHFERSLVFWQQSDNLERRGCLLFSLGLWWRTYATLRRDQYVTACSQAKEYYWECIKVFQQAQRPDLAAKFINALGEVLLKLQLEAAEQEKLKYCHELEDVAQKALKLHQTYPEPVRCAYAYGLLAEVALTKSAWQQAQEYAETAQQILVNAAYLVFINNSEGDNSNLDRAPQYHRGWYLLLMAIAQQHLGNVSQALEYLITAKKESKPQHDPPLYIRILETLRSLYFEQGEYSEAFEVKQERRAIEQQYGFRTFIGAGELQPQAQVVNLALAPFEPQETVNAIAASGRQKTIDYLIERISRNDTILTVLYGQSGVGKSSIINAGLIPALKNRIIQGQKVLLIVLRTYVNWENDLGEHLIKALQEIRGIELPTELYSSTAILEQLQKTAELSLRIVLIFEHFAQLFFIKNQNERKIFWTFLQQCLNIASIRIIFVIREDYLHYLLEIERLAEANETKNDVLKDLLNRQNRYYLKNFSIEEAKAVIEQLTERAHFNLEPNLVDELVHDLAQGSGEVRPIELQIVGTQLQTKGIQTLDKYRQFGPNSKEKLVHDFLEKVIEDCGPPNKNIAEVVLHLLINNETNTSNEDNVFKPLKSIAQLTSEASKFLLNDLASKEAKLKLVLHIFVKSGIVVLLQEIYHERYQLVHDYLIPFIRQRSEMGLITTLKDEKKRREKAEDRINHLLKWALAGLVRENAEVEKIRRKLVEARFKWVLGGVVVLVGLLIALAVDSNRKLTINDIHAINANSEALFASNREIDALKEGLKAVQKLKSESWKLIDTDTKSQATTALDQAIYLIKERNQLQRHNDTVFNVSFSPDGKTIASVSGDNTVKLWQSNGTLIKTLGHSDDVVDISFAPNSKTFASASWDGTVKLWQSNGTLIKTLKGHIDQVWDVSFSPDGNTIASASADGTVKLWNADGTMLATLIGHNDGVGRVEFSSDNQMIVSASEDKTVKLWRLDGTLLKTLKAHDDDVLDVSFSPDGRTIASASADKTVKLWNRNGNLLKTLTGHEGAIYDVSFSPDGQIASASEDSTVKLWNRDGELLKTLTGHSNEVYRVNFSRNGQMLASGSRDNTINLWRINSTNHRRITTTLLTTLKGHRDAVIGIDFSQDSHMLASASYDRTVKLWKLNNDLLTILEGHTDWVSGVSFSPNGKIVASTSRDNTVKLWKRDGTLFKTLEHSGWVTDVSFSPDGHILASASYDGTIKLWRSDGTLPKTLTGHTQAVVGLNFSPDGQLLASASADNTVKLWTRDGKLLKILNGHSDRVYEVSFSPDDQLLASASADSTVKLWTRDGKLLKTLFGHSDRVYGVSFSPDGQMLASASADNTVKLWTRDGKLLKILDSYYSDRVNGVSFSPDSQMLASASADNTVKLWTRDGKLIKTLDGHTDRVYGVSFSPDGQMLASASADKTVKLWRRDGTFLITLRGHTDAVSGVSFSRDSRTLASASNDKTLILWDLSGYLDNQVLDTLLIHGCNWLSDYLNANSDITENQKLRVLCKPIQPSSK